MNNIEIEAKIKEFENVLKELMGESSYSEYMSSFHKAKITTWLRSTLTTFTQKHEDEKAAMVREITAMADKLESDCGLYGDIGTERWKLFKGFRNTIRDKYLSKTDVTE